MLKAAGGLVNLGASLIEKFASMFGINLDIIKTIKTIFSWMNNLPLNMMKLMMSMMQNWLRSGHLKQFEEFRNNLAGI
jgi:hypothetical protein